jgi:hypothetical protein
MPAPRSKRRALAVRLTAVVLGVGLTVGLLELGLRLFYPIPLHATDTYLAAPATWQSGAMVLVPGAVIREKTSEWDIDIRINSNGLRDREIPYEKPKGTYRVLVLGDSQTFGQGVEAEETYAKVLERSLAERMPGKVEVVNTGVPGTGTVHQFWYLEDKGWQYNPDAVLVGFYFNDVVDNAQCHLYGLENGKLIRTGVASSQQTPAHKLAPQVIPEKDYRAMRSPEVRPPPSPPFLVRYSYLARLVRVTLSRIKQSRNKPVAVSRPARKMTAAVFREIARQCKERGIRCVIALIPSKEQKAEGEVKTLRETWAELLPGAEQNGAQVVDLWPPFEKQGFPGLFLRTDPHLSAAGHKLIGETLAREFPTAARSPARRDRSAAAGSSGP